MPDSNSSALFGLVTLDPPLYFERASLGTVAKVSIGGVPGTINVPGPPEWGDNPADPLHTPLVAPAAAGSWKRGQTPLQWGFPASFPASAGRVDLVLMQFDIPESERRCAGSSILQHYDAWRTLFIEHIELLTKQRSTPAFAVHNRTDDLDLFYWSDSKSLSDFDSSPMSITTWLQAESNYITPDKLCVACEFASNGKELPLEYRVLIQAYRANARGDYRAAIIEAATASEIALTSSIRAKFAADNITYADKLLAKFRMLSGRIELAQTIGLPLPAMDLQHNLVQPRNDVIHKAHFASMEVARAALAAAELIIAEQPSALYAGRI